MPRSTSRAESKKKSDQHLRTQTLEHEIVDPIWLLKAIGVTIVAALICGYLTLCLLFYQGQWQLVLHPARTSSSPPSIAGVHYDTIHFSPDESAITQLTGWWIPAERDARYVHATILFLPGADGSLVNSIPVLATLHNFGINVFAFDYRGYGQSAPTHPNQQRMVRDAESAFQYLTSSRGILPLHIIPYGMNIGAPLAAHLASTHPTIPAVILDEPYSDLLPIAQHDPRATILPVRLLFHNRFPLAEPLATLKTPKLLISRTASVNKKYQAAADPKVTIELPANGEALNQQSLTRFFDRYVYTH